MKKTLLIASAVLGIALVVMGFEGTGKNKIIEVERVGVGNWHTTMYINANQVVAFEQAQPNSDGAATKVYFGSPSHGSDDKTVVMGISNGFDDFKQQMQDALQ